MALLVSDAGAQSADDLLRFIKPWIKRQLLGGEKPATETEAPEAPEDVGSENLESEEAPAVVAAPANDMPTAVETESQGEVAAAPAPAPAENAGIEDAAGLSEAAAAPGEPAEIPLEETHPPLRFGVLADRSPAVTMAAVGPIADDISAIVDRPVELLPMISYGAMIDAQVERRIDGGFYSASAFALADSRCHCLEPIVAPRASDGTIAYHAVIVARADSGIASAFDLEGKTVAIGAADSVGARRMQLAGLAASGLDAATVFGGVIEAGSANEAVRLVRDGVADAAFAWSSLSGDAARGYSRGTLTELVANGEIAMRDIAVVWRSPAITHGPFAVLTSLSEEEQDRIGAFLLALEATRPAAYDQLNPFYGGGYAPVEPKDYGGLETLTAQNVDALRLPKAAAAIPPASVSRQVEEEVEAPAAE